MELKKLKSAGTVIAMGLVLTVGCEAKLEERPVLEELAAATLLADEEVSEAPAEPAAAEGGKIIVAAPGKVCRENGGTFGSSFDVLDLGEPHLQVVRSIPLNTKLVKTGDQLRVKILRNGRVLSRAQLVERTSEFVVTDASGFSHVPLFSGATIRVKVLPGETVSVQDPAMRNFGKSACVQLRPERLPA